MTTSVNKYGPPPLEEPEHKSETQDNMAAHVTDVVVDDETVKEPEPVEYMAPTNDDFFTSNILDIN
jgi:hypothetical protein